MNETQFYCRNCKPWGMGAAEDCKLHLAASDLLIQLKYMVRDWIEIVGDEDENRTPADRLEKAKAAIAKAEG